MLTTYYAKLAQMICEERVRGYREPVTLGRPAKPRHTWTASGDGLGATPGVVRVIRSVAQAAAGLLM